MRCKWHKAPPCASERSSDLSPTTSETSELRADAQGGALCHRLGLEDRGSAGGLTWRGVMRGKHGAVWLAGQIDVSIV